MKVGVGNFRRTAVLSAVVLAVAGSIDVDVGGYHVHSGPAGHVEADGSTVADVDLHQFCESVLRECWNLDPAALGMTPVTGLLPSINGTITEAEWEAGTNLQVRLLGEHVHGGAHSGGSANVSNGGESGEEAQVPCADSPQCPDLIVNVIRMQTSLSMDEREFGSGHCAVQENSTAAGHRRLLRFTFGSPNVALGDLEIGNPAEHPEWFEWGACHQHWHFRQYADYRLWDTVGYIAWQAIRAAHPGVQPGDLLAAYPELSEHLRTGHKQGFCVIDVIPFRQPPAGPQQFTDCMTNQGLSSFWEDVYNFGLDGQWVDVTGLPAGRYVLEAEVNPEQLYVESSYDNNAAAVLVNVT